jgi:hypothetical protein
VIERESKNYPIAANWLKKAKKAYVQKGQTQQWQAYRKRSKNNISDGPPCRFSYGVSRGRCDEVQTKDP